MSDDEPDLELLELLRQSLGMGKRSNELVPAETRVLEGAQHVFDNAIDVAVDPFAIKAAARTILHQMQKKEYSTKTWSSHELHPKGKDESTVDFIFTMDLLNFSFWSDEKDESKQFGIQYRGRKWTGYWGLVAAMQRALDEEIPITSSDFWQNEDECTDEVLRHVFRSATNEEIPLFSERMECLREAGRVLYDKYRCSFTNCISEANGSAAALVNLVAESFPCFRDEFRFEGRRVRFYKRAQILVADLWACFEGKSYGKFHDINKITIFPDYRIPQMLHNLGCLRYSPLLETHVRHGKIIPSGGNWEIELRGTSIWCVEMIRKEILKQNPGIRGGSALETPKPEVPEPQSEVVNGHEELENDANGDGIEATEEPNGDSNSGDNKTMVNAILIDFFLYDTMKELEEEGKVDMPHHRTRSIWY
ncbi:hypothetical protein FQN54_006723 [Arachnomyces sp. PD_36]|nr:hypothetical protein FQN54_006723 [Arachnomyces sp. PD_36]